MKGLNYLRGCFSAKIALRICFVCALWQLFAGAILIEVRPYFQLDQLLTQEQLQDDALKARTLAALRQANVQYFALLGVPAVLILPSSAFGLWKLRQAEKSYSLTQ